VEVGVGFDPVADGLQSAAAFDQHRLQVVQIGEGAVGHRLIDQAPEPLSRLQLGRVGREEGQVEPLRQHQVRADMPAGLIDDEDGSMGGVDSFIMGEGGQRQGKGFGRDPRQQTPPTLAGAGADKAIDMQPCVVPGDGCGRPLPLARPYPPNDGEQTQPVLILRPA
jgi:hypothetical protein